MKRFKVTFKESFKTEPRAEFEFFASSKAEVKNSILRFANLLYYGSEKRLPKVSKRELDFVTISSINGKRFLGSIHAMKICWAPYCFDLEIL